MGNHLDLRSAAPQYVYSTAPLSFSDGRPVAPPMPGGGGYSLALNDKQVLLATDFANFPSKAITVEFWMFSTDTCRPGVPFSYAAGDYAKSDNSFLLFNYNSWGVSVMEDEGVYGDHLSGVRATDANWHHIAVTWDSHTGKVVLYDNGRPQWSTFRGKGKSIPSGGTLVIGREQDCTGGCFDSASGAAGRTSEIQEYGAQDFFGVIEEMRVWNVVRSPEEVRKGMEMDDGRGPGGFYSPGIDPATPGLVAYWKFDEGSGYLVHDVTGHGHDLSITQPPKWEVTRWLSTCGNAVVEGEEECDDGDLTDGDGCNSACIIEPGWECVSSPSKCKRKSEAPHPHVHPSPQPAPSPAPKPSPHHPEPSSKDRGHHSSRDDDGMAPQGRSGHSGAGGGNRGSQAGGNKDGSGQSKTALLAVLATLGGVTGLALITAVGIVQRQRLGAVVPQGLTDAISSAGSFVSEGVLQILPSPLRERAGGYTGLNAGLSFAPNEDLHDHLAPDFMAFSPGPNRTAPGTPGPYTSVSNGNSVHGPARGRGENALV